MADNYLEKKMEEFKAMPSAGVASKNSQKKSTVISKLVAENRYYKSFDNRIIVREQHLKNLIDLVSEKSPNASADKLHYYPTTNISEVSAILDYLKIHNPELINFKNQEQLPKSFILIGCNRTADSNTSKILYFQLGSISNTITLRATEMGLNGTSIILSEHNNLQDLLKLPFIPHVAIAIGKGRL